MPASYLPGQAEIPGTAPASGPELAKRRAAQPLRPSAPQAPCDVGLFGDAAAQADLVDRARAAAADVFTVKLAYMGRSLPDAFTSLAAARKAAVRTGFTCWISDAHGIVGEWCPVGGWSCNRMTRRDGELFHFTDRRGGEA
jgi:hypothetical protein